MLFQHYLGLLIHIAFKKNLKQNYFEHIGGNTRLWSNIIPIGIFFKFDDTTSVMSLYMHIK